MWRNLIWAALATVVVGACGTRGALTLPPKPAAANKPPATVPATTDNASSDVDSSTAGRGRR